ncbi:hypothetical protein HanHA300_Chr08g0286981 [Helianthus annuus]|nr:hypothetical protein HanHA300_Chr08g0286981 [Helianthus annuus]
MSYIILFFSFYLQEKVTEHLAKSSSHATNRANGPPYAQSAVSMDSDDGISYKAIGGTAGQLLEQNAQAFDQISANFAAFKVSMQRSLIRTIEFLVGWFSSNWKFDTY